MTDDDDDDEPRGRPEMPEDWDDHAGWEAFQAASVGRGDEIDADEARFARDLEELGFRRVWFPGCGLSGGPALYAALGFTVLATDVSATAVGWQAEVARDGLPKDQLTRLLARHERKLPEGSAGSLSAAVHDHRQPLDADPFDVVINFKAIQALPDASLRAAAQVHFDALRPGGRAVFGTMNLQGHARERLEASLEDAGFFVPVRRATKWYREALDSTGLDYAFILGVPRVYAVGEYLDRPKRLAAEARLAEFRAEFEHRAEEEWSQTSVRMKDGVSRVAHVVYNTG